MDKRLLDILRCPVTRQPLALLSAQSLERVNAAIAEDTVRDRGDQPCRTPLRAALITRDHKLLYPIEDDIPVLLPDRGIVVAAIDGLRP